MSLPAITLRPIGEADLTFLYEVYASTRTEELAPLGWNDAQQAAFLAQQFAAQHQHYQQHYSDASFQVILVDGQPAGRLYVARWPTEIRLVDIALLPAARGAGIGTRLLHDLLDESAAAQKPIRLHVEKFNPALRLYQRFGFVSVEDRGIYWLMEWVHARSGQSRACARLLERGSHTFRESGESSYRSI